MGIFPFVATKKTEMREKRRDAHLSEAKNRVTKVYGTEFLYTSAN